MHNLGIFTFWDLTALAIKYLISETDLYNCMVEEKAYKVCIFKNQGS